MASRLPRKRAGFRTFALRAPAVAGTTKLYGARFLIAPGIFLGERAHEVNKIPAYSFLRPIAFSRHFSFAITNDPKEFPIGHFFQRSGIAPIADLQLHVRNEVTLTISGVSVTHRAIVAIQLAYFCQTFRRGLDRAVPAALCRRH